MIYYTCRDQFEDKMSCIYTAWEKALKCGHSNIRLKVEPIYQETLFDEYNHIDADEEKVEKVVRTIKNKLSSKGLFYVYRASLSSEEDSLDTIYRWLIKGFKVGPSVFDNYADPDVMRFVEINRRVGNEAHFFREFARFTSMDDKIYICHIEPKDNVISIVADHFANRMPSEHFMIIDDNRRYAIVHPKDEDNYIRFFTEDEMERLSTTESYEDEYTDMWRTFFNTIAIKERINPKCQRNMMPLWYRKHAVEFFEMDKE